MINKTQIENLQSISKRLRTLIVQMVYNAKSGHIGGSLSSADVLTALYFHEMNVDAENPRLEDRDRFVLSKGHITPAYYGVLALRGFFPVEELATFRKLNSRLQGHPDKNKTPGVDMSSGSLGQGISAATGMALAGKLSGKTHRVFCLLGDGEMQEGQVWEALAFASARKLDNLCVIVDNNGVQADGKVQDICPIQPLKHRLKDFGFAVCEANGHDFKSLIKAFARAKKNKGKPFAIIANTVKGKGVSFMENQSSWHGNVPNAEQFEKAMAEIERA